MKRPIEVIFGMVTNMHLIKNYARKCLPGTFVLLQFDNILE